AQGKGRPAYRAGQQPTLDRIQCRVGDRRNPAFVDVELVAWRSPSVRMANWKNVDAVILAALAFAANPQFPTIGQRVSLELGRIPDMPQPSRQFAHDHDIPGADLAICSDDHLGA